MTKILVCWDENGLESCIDLTECQKKIDEFDRERIIEILKDPDQRYENRALLELNHMVNAILMRARINSQRHYEVYVVDLDDTISIDDVRDQFESCPQEIVNLIRQHGTSLFSNRRNSNVRIT